VSMRSRTVRIVALAVAVVLSVGVLGVPASSAQPGTTQPWTDRHLSPEQRARLLMAQMTLAEKVDLMTGNQGEAPYAFYNAPIHASASRR
jgi:beta-glucosidase